MKSILLGLAVLGSLSANAAVDLNNIACQGTPFKGQLDTFSFVAKSLYGEGNRMRFKDVKAQSVSDKVTTGRVKYLVADSDYTPRKYKNHARFDLTKLVDTTSFDNFEPWDDCYLKVMIPYNAGTSFQAPVQYSCDQGGGAFTMNCSAEIDRE